MLKYKPKYKVGDKVYIREDLKCSTYVSNDGNFLSVTPKMLNFAGKIVKIIEKDYDGDYVIFGCDFWFSDDMIDHGKTLELTKKKEKEKLGIAVPYLSDSDVINVVAETMDDLAIGNDLPDSYNVNIVIDNEENLDKYDNVNKPKHYTSSKIECINYLKDKLSSEQFEGFCIGNALKYLSRYKLKNGLEDLKKSQWYLNYIIKEQEKIKEVINTMQNKVKEEVGE